MSSASNPAAPRPTPRSEMSPETPKKRLSGKTIAALILLAISLAFIFSNLDTGAIRFLGFQFIMPVWIWFLGVLLVGVIIGSLFPWFRPRNRKR